MSNDFLEVVEMCLDIDFGLSDCRLYFVCTSIIFSSTVGSRIDPRRNVGVTLEFLLFDYQKSDEAGFTFKYQRKTPHFLPSTDCRAHLDTRRLGRVSGSLTLFLLTAVWPKFYAECLKYPNFGSQSMRLILPVAT